MILCNHSDFLNGSVLLPSSKSLSNRALVIQFLSSKSITLNNLSTAHDTVLMQKLIKEIKTGNKETFLDCEDAGTVMRFLTALCATIPYRTFNLSGTKRMLARPIHELTSALKQLDIPVHHTNEDGFPPIKIEGQNIKKNKVSISGLVSSQFISALCLIAPQLPEGLEIEIHDELVSKTYIEMTLGLMNHFGVVTQFDSHQIRIPHTQYVSQAYTIENDWSGATFFYAMAMLKPSHIELNHLSQNSLQGDAWIVTLASYFGVQSTFTKDTLIIQSANTAIYSGPPILDFIHHPDMAIPIIVCCALKWNNVQLCGLTHLEYKESKRLTALQTELLKIGIELVYNNDLLRFKKIENFILPSKVHFDTYDDHRLAMALSMVSLQGIDVELKDIDCVKKSFPNFWNEIKKLGYIQA